MRITTNNHYRNLTYGYELSEAERKDFDYLAREITDSDGNVRHDYDTDDFMMHDFLRYRGVVYDVSEFTTCPPELAAAGWQWFRPDTFFSGVAIAFSDDCEQVRVATVFA